MSKSAFQKLRWVKPTTEVATTEFTTALAPGADPARAAALRAMIAETGLPQSVTPLSVVEEARLLLRAAAEVEHALLVQYLYAAYSIKDEGDAGTWRFELVQIAIEEMGHLLTLQNLLLAIGGAPYFDREQVTIGEPPASGLPFPLRLEPVTPDSLAKYVTAESPLLAAIPDAALRAHVEEIAEQAAQAAHQPIHHVGALYAMLFWLFQPTDAPHPLWPELPTDELLKHAAGRHLTARDFVDTTEPRQARPQEFRRSVVDPPNGDNLYVIPVRSRIEALFALDLIAEQGEGFKLGTGSHFERFLAIYDHFESDLAGHIVPVAVNPSTSNAGTDQTPITHPAALLWASLFNARYEMLLLKLALALQQPRGGGSGVLSRANLFKAAVEEMRVGVRDVAERLAAFSQSGVAAGAPFELPATPFPADDASIRQRLRQVIQAAAVLMQSMGDLSGADALTDEEKSALADLKTVDTELLTALGT